MSSPSSPKPMASLVSGMLGRRVEGRRVPLSFAPVETDAPDAAVPEVLRQIERLAVALGLGAPEPVEADGTKRRRIASTVRLDPTRHAHVRQIANARATSVQCVLVEALDLYLATIPSTPTMNATPPSRVPRSTGNKP